MSIKKYTNGSWTPASRKYGTETDTITTLPATIIGDGTLITSYTVKGNMKQTGTPTPENPIMPIGCGERTENLFDYTDLEGGYIDLSIGINMPNDGQKRTKNYITVQANTTYTLSNYDGKCRVHMYSNNSYLGNVLTNESQYSFTTNSNCTRIRIAGFKDNFFETTMLILGSTAPTSYVPYGYKLPLTLGSTTTDIYLGEVQTTRRIGKIDLSEVSWTKLADGLWRTLDIPNIKYSSVNTELGGGIAEKYTIHTGAGMISALNCIAIDVSQVSVNTGSNTETPTGMFWYVLAEPETGIVNEPIRKIGDYADSVSGTGLATSGTAQEFDINTTLKPSEVDMTYHGWHEHDDTKFTT